MRVLYVTSTGTFSGKTALCVGLGKHMQQEGFAVGYMKPVSTTARRVEGRIVDEDAQFMVEALGLPEPGEIVSPVTLAPNQVIRILAGEDQVDYVAQLKKAFDEAAAKRQVMILEGGASVTEGALVGLSAANVIQQLRASALVVTKYESDLVVDDILGAKALHGDAMIGAVINAVPRQRMRFVQEVIKPYLEKRGISVFGVLPQERLLLSISVDELADCLMGEILCRSDRGDELVEYLMVGAMSVDSALTYFRRKPNKAVITGGDRPDIQLAALETSTKCLILTGNLRPSPIIMARAEEVGVPMILVKQDTLTAVEIIEQSFGKTRFHQEQKIERFQEMMRERFEFEGLYIALGLRPTATS
ncbi:MAG: phosphotransacetylase family protein [Chloroflexota bacterium]